MRKQQTELTVGQAAVIVKQIADHAIYALQNDTTLDVQLLAERMLCQISHPEIMEIVDDKHTV